MKTIETPRLLLRPWSMDDAEQLFALAQDPDVGPRAGWPPHQSVDESREVIRTVFANDHTWAIVLKETDELIGCMGYYTHEESNIGIGEMDAELGYWIGKPYWGQGLIPEASRALMRYAFEELGMRAVWCGYYDGNEKSRKVQTKLGFVYQHKTEGLEVRLMNEIRTGHCNLMTKERWQKVELFRKQKNTLDTFRERNAITQAQYDKSLGDLRNLMEMHGVE